MIFPASPINAVFGCFRRADSDSGRLAFGLSIPVDISHTIGHTDILTEEDPMEDRRFPLHRVRMAVRITVLALFAFDCIRLILLYLWSNGAVDTNLGRPQLTAGLSPLGGLFDLVTWIRTGQVDPVLPASMVIVILGIVMSVLVKRSFCGWMCPIGTILDGLGVIGRRITRGVHVNPRVLAVLRAPKTIIGLLIVGIVAFLIPSSVIISSWSSLFWAASDMAVVLVFLKPGIAIVCVALAVLGLSLLLGRNFWCECLCPLGGIYGVASLASPVTVKRDPQVCIGCGACTKACPQHLTVDESAHAIRAIECVGCMECVAVCPESGALQPRLFGRVRVGLVAIPIAVLTIWIAVWLVSVLLGAWFGTASPEWVSLALASLG